MGCWNALRGGKWILFVSKRGGDGVVIFSLLQQRGSVRATRFKLLRRVGDHGTAARQGASNHVPQHAVQTSEYSIEMTKPTLT